MYYFSFLNLLSKLPATSEAGLCITNLYMKRKNEISNIQLYVPNIKPQCSKLLTFGMSIILCAINCEERMIIFLILRKIKSRHI